MDVRLPRLGEGADSGVVATVFVKVGDVVKKDQPVMELESEKAVATIPAPAAGTVAKVFVKEGDEVKVGALIIALSDDGKSIQQEPAAAQRDSGVAGNVRDSTAAIEVHAEPAFSALAMQAAADFPIVNPPDSPPPASPSLRKIARELGIDLHRVRGSERGGRIVMADLRAYVQKLQQVAVESPVSAQMPSMLSKPVAPSIDFSRWGPIDRKKLTTLRKAIVAKMSESWATAPHVTQFDDVDVTAILQLRKKYTAAYEKKGAHLTLTSFALKAVVDTLKKHPNFNASLDEAAAELIMKGYFHIGIAVDTEQGLIVPVLRDVDKKSILELSIELRGLAEKTRERKITIEEMQGGTFTISNQGGIGSKHFTPIINVPEVAILGLGRGSAEAVVLEGKVQQRTILPLALSYDHRVNDGADAARFMVDLVGAFESISEADVRI
jgi:pyruvate dehydrogenase E2 component (dihydrolipoamide acetyltransferase)